MPPVSSRRGAAGSVESHLGPPTDASLILGHMELIAQMAGLPQAGMDTGPLSRLEGFCGHFDILVDRTGETPYRAPVVRDLANLLH